MASNSLLSPTIITREALRILHANLNFVGNINKQYDDQFANAGASPSGKIGPSLTIRMPNQYKVRTGSVLQVQDTVETSQDSDCLHAKGCRYCVLLAGSHSYHRRVLEAVSATGDVGAGYCD